MNVETTIHAPTREQIELLEEKLLQIQQLDTPVTHHFAPGVYVREIFMPAGAFIIGHEHKTEHFNVVLSGKASVLCDGKVIDITAPYIFVSKPGVRKMLFIKEDVRWATIHPSEETDLEKLEPLLIHKSAAFTAHQADLAALKAHVEKGITV